MLKQSILVSIATLLSRIAGLVRDIFMASFFGASLLTDAFFLAFRIPNFLRRILAEGSFTQAFVPVLKETKLKYDQIQVQLLINQTFIWLSIITFSICVAGIFFSPVVVNLYAYGISGNSYQYDITVSMLRIMFPYLFCISITALFSSIANSYGHFFAAALNPLWLNISMILGMILSIYFEIPIYTLAWSVLIGGLLQLLFIGLEIKRIGLSVQIEKPRKHQGVIRILKLIIPTILATSVMQINLLINLQIASFLPNKSISWLSYADRLMSLPWALIAVAVSTVILPSLSSLKDSNDSNKGSVNDILIWAIELVFLFGIPASVGLFLLSDQIISTLFYYGEFTIYDIDNTSKALMAYTLGLPFLMLVKIFATGFFSQQNSLIVAKISIFSILCNIVSSLLLFSILQHVGLALSNSIAAFINSSLLFILLVQRGYIIISKELILRLTRIFISSLAMIATIMTISYLFDLSVFFGSESIWWERIVFLSGYIFIAAISYFLIMFSLGWKASKLKYKSSY